MRIRNSIRFSILGYLFCQNWLEIRASGSRFSLQRKFCYTQVRGDPCTNLVFAGKNQVATWKTKESGISLEDKLQKHEFQGDSDTSIQELHGQIDSQRREIDHTITSDKQLRRDQFLLDERPSEQNRDLREVHIKFFEQMEELMRVQGLRVDESSRRRLIENQDTINEFTAKIQELQIEVNCMNDSRGFKDAESVRSGLSHVPNQPVFFSPIS